MLVLFVLPTFARTADQMTSENIPATEDPQCATASAACKTSWKNSDYVLPWGETRKKLADKGFTFNIFYITDALGDPSVPHGTREVFQNWQRARATVDYDFGKATRLKGLSFHATGVWQNGQNMGAIIGSVANPSSLVSSHEFRVDSIWLQQTFLKNKFQVTAGLMASQDFYGVQEYGGYFVNEPMGYNYGTMGNVRASYDPSSGPAGNLRIMPNRWIWIQSGFFMPSDPNSSRNVYPTGFNYSNGFHGSTWNFEAGVHTFAARPITEKNYAGVIKGGYIFNSSNAGATVCPNCPGGFYNYKKGRYDNDNWLIYGQIAQPVWREKAGSTRGLDMTFGATAGPSNKTGLLHQTTGIDAADLSSQFTMGAIFHGPIAQRPRDSISFGVVYSLYENGYKGYFAQTAPVNLQLYPNYGPGTTHSGQPQLANEQLYELNYSAMIMAGWQLQPVVQFYNNVGGTKNAATVAGFRLKVTF